MNKKYHLIVFGCQMNISDAERVAGVLESLKYKNTPNINDADLIVVTMCSVRQSAVDRVHGLVEKIKKLKAKNHKLKAVLTGCILKKDKKIFVEGFDYVLDIKDIRKLKLLLHSAECKSSLLGRSNNDYLKITPKYKNKFSANVPIMQGCNNFCSYCVVPYTRDREISRSAKDIIVEIKNLVKSGVKEIWLLGQNVNSYKDENIRFSELLKKINKIPGNFWIRFTSSHPKDFSDELINAMTERKHITPYLNLPIQAGDNEILKAMNRHYSVAEYKNKIKKLREKIPNIALSTDIIVGFPGETKKQFENTAKLFYEIKYDMAYINKYSPRAGTASAKLKDNVSWPEKKRREKVLTEILKQTALEKNKKLLGKTTTALIDSQRDNFYFGKNKHYKTIKIVEGPTLHNLAVGEFAKVKITEIAPFTLTGKII